MIGERDLRSCFCWCTCHWSGAIDSPLFTVLGYGAMSHDVQWCSMCHGWSSICCLEPRNIMWKKFGCQVQRLCSTGSCQDLIRFLDLSRALKESLQVLAKVVVNVYQRAQHGWPAMASCMLRSDAAEDQNHWTFQLSEACHLVSVCFSRCKQINDPNMYLEILGGGTVAKHGKQYQGVQWCSSMFINFSWTTLWESDKNASWEQKQSRSK